MFKEQANETHVQIMQFLEREFRSDRVPEVVKIISNPRCICFVFDRTNSHLKSRNIESSALQVISPSDVAGVFRRWIGNNAIAYGARNPFSASVLRSELESLASEIATMIRSTNNQTARAHNLRTTNPKAGLDFPKWNSGEATKSNEIVTERLNVPPKFLAQYKSTMVRKRPVQQRWGSTEGDFNYA
jgi:hypothetical protein